MTMPTAVLAGLTLIAAAIFLTNGNQAFSQDDPSGGRWGPWSVKGINEKTHVFKINTNTGELFACTNTCLKIETK